MFPTVNELLTSARLLLIPTGLPEPAPPRQNPLLPTEPPLSLQLPEVDTGRTCIVPSEQAVHARVVSVSVAEVTVAPAGMLERLNFTTPSRWRLAGVVLVGPTRPMHM